MAQQMVTGTVESVKIEEGFARTFFGWTETALILKATLRLADGRAAYLSTQVGRRMENDLSRNESLSPSQINAAKPLAALEKNTELVRSSTPEMFPNAIYLVGDHVRNVLCTGDLLTVKGQVEVRTSQRGTQYITIKRATAVKCVRQP